MVNMGNNKVRGRVLYVGQAYYNAWYLSRELRKLGWIADQLNVDHNPENQKYYHGQDFIFKYETEKDKIDNFKFFVHATIAYDIFHFSNAHKLDFITDFDYVPPWYQGKKYFLIRKLAFLIRIIALFILDKYCQWDAIGFMHLCIKLESKEYISFSKPSLTLYPNVGIFFY